MTNPLFDKEDGSSLKHFKNGESMFKYNKEHVRR